ncbi:MAG: nitroreductase family protein [Candidatus Heimdallarchaeota archaeon]
MDAYTQVIHRLEIRNFAEEQNIPNTIVRKIVEAGRLSPSAMNRQPWKFKVITNPGKLAELASIHPHARFVGSAGFAVAVYTSDQKFGPIDATRAISHMQIAAWVLSPRIGSCFNFGWNELQVQEIIGAVKGYQLFTIIPFGYPRISKVKGKKNRKSWHEVVLEDWDT